MAPDGHQTQPGLNPHSELRLRWQPWNLCELTLRRLSSDGVIEADK